MGLEEASCHLAALQRRITAGRSERVSQLWDGAGVVIRKLPLPPDDGESFYPSPRCIVTPWAKELSWVFGELVPVMRLADVTDREQFFGDVTDAVFAYQATTVGADDLKMLLMAAVAGADRHLARGRA